MTVVKFPKVLEEAVSPVNVEQSATSVVMVPEKGSSTVAMVSRLLATVKLAVTTEVNCAST
jgi:hypothetical protein